MKCQFERCGFEAVGECGVLDWNHSYCLKCNEIIHFNCRTPKWEMGRCLHCGTYVQQNRNGSSVWFGADHKFIYQFPADEAFSRSAVQQNFLVHR